MSHELIHSTAQVGCSVTWSQTQNMSFTPAGCTEEYGNNTAQSVQLTQRVRAASPSHSRQVVRGQKHFEEALKWLALNERVQASSIQAQSTEHIGERSQHLTSSRNLERKTMRGCLHIMPDSDLGQSVVHRNHRSTSTYKHFLIFKTEPKLNNPQYQTWHVLN